MAKESVHRKEAVERLEKEGFVVWGPEKTRSFGSKDIFTIFDLACQRSGYYITKYIQLTDHTNHAKRRKKVQDYLAKHDLMFWCEVWSWNPKTATFRREEIDAPSPLFHPVSR